MKKSKAKQIVENDEEIDVKQMADALFELGKHKDNLKRGNPLIGWRKKQILNVEEEQRRQNIARLWNKYKKP